MINTIEVTKIVEFEMAHALHNHSGQCKNVHGHTYKLEVTLKGATSEAPHQANDGMVIDFSALKGIIEDEIICIADHALWLNHLDPRAGMLEPNPMFGKMQAVSYNPTCENMVAKFASILKEVFYEKGYTGLTLTKVRLWETSNSYATWRYSDNIR